MQNIKDGLSRSRENALLRDKMSGLSEAELNRAMTDLERREAAQKRKGQTLTDKLGDDVE